MLSDPGVQWLYHHAVREAGPPRFIGEEVRLPEAKRLAQGKRGRENPPLVLASPHLFLFPCLPHPLIFFHLAVSIHLPSPPSPFMPPSIQYLGTERVWVRHCAWSWGHSDESEPRPRSSSVWGRRQTRKQDLITQCGDSRSHTANLLLQSVLPTLGSGDSSLSIL